MARQPSFQFYPGDWLRDNVSGCSLAAQGLWLRMLLLMHDSERRGYLAMNGSPMPPAHVARRCGSDLAQYETLLAELDAAGVPSRTSDGTIYSRRMVKDTQEKAKGAEYVRAHRDRRSKDGCKGECKADVRGEKDPSSSSSSSSEKEERQEEKSPLYNPPPSVKPQPKAKAPDHVEAQAQEVLAYLNQATGKRFQSPGKIPERIRAGATVDDCKRVIDNKLTDPKFDRKYLDHTTLFREGNFDRYLNETPADHKPQGQQRPIGPKQPPKEFSHAKYGESVVQPGSFLADA